MSEESEQDEKTQDPTQRRLEQARERGQVPMSKEVSHWIMLTAITAIIVWIIPQSLRKMLNFSAFILGHCDKFPQTITELASFSQVTGYKVMQFCLIPFAVLMVSALFAGGVQTRFLISTQQLKPAFNKISPVKGFGRMFSRKAMMEFVKNMIKLIIVVTVTYTIFWPQRAYIIRITSVSTENLLKILGDLSLSFLMWILSIFGVIAGLDYFYQRFAWLQTLKMTPQEIKEEVKEQEGDPQIKGRIRQIRYERARRRMITEVPKATVLITNPTHYAIALKYDMETMGAPVVVAKGVDLIALKMREIAKDNHVAIVESPPLAQALYRDVKEGKEIPFQHYQAVADIIRYILSRKR